MLSFVIKCLTIFVLILALFHYAPEISDETKSWAVNKAVNLADDKIDEYKQQEETKENKIYDLEDL